MRPERAIFDTRPRARLWLGRRRAPASHRSLVAEFGPSPRHETSRPLRRFQRSRPVLPNPPRRQRPPPSRPPRRPRQAPPRPPPGPRRPRSQPPLPPRSRSPRRQRRSFPPPPRRRLPRPPPPRLRPPRAQPPRLRPPRAPLFRPCLVPKTPRPPAPPPRHLPPVRPLRSPPPALPLCRPAHPRRPQRAPRGDWLRSNRLVSDSEHGIAPLLRHPGWSVQPSAPRSHPSPTPSRRPTTRPRRDRRPGHTSRSDWAPLAQKRETGQQRPLGPRDGKRDERPSLARFRSFPRAASGRPPTRPPPVRAPRRK
jgi:hypothetical protein